MPYIGELSALLTALLWSGTSLAFSSAAVKIGPLQLNINRMILACVFLASTIFIFNFDTSITLKQIIYLSISGFIGLVFGDSFLFKAYELIGARISMLLMALSPAMAAIFAFFFLGEGLSFWGITGMLVTITGVAFVILERNELPGVKVTISKPGIFYGVLGALGQAAGLIFAKFAFQEGEVDKMVATFIRIFASVAILLPAAIILKKYLNPIALYKNDIRAFGATLIGTVLGPYLGITFSLVAISYTKVGIASTLMSTMPILMLPMVHYIYKEKLTMRAIAGAFIAVAGVAILFLR